MGLVILSFLCILLLAGALSFTAVRAMGKKNLKESVEATHPELETKETETINEAEAAVWKEGWIKYKDNIYEYNSDLITFLFMGIDKNGKAKEVKEGTNGGQADSLFLVVLNPQNQTINVVGINRNTMCQIDVYDKNGEYSGSATAQIATQHGFGNGVEESCEYQVEAVRRLMYNIPINGYSAINMKAIPILNDAIGGVDVVAISDVYNEGNARIIKEGDSVHLMGQKAYWYVRDRDEEEFASADMRLARQKQYLQGFIQTAKGAVKSDITMVKTLYDDVTPYMTTNVTADELVYLAPEIVNYKFGENQIFMIPGETTQGEVYEEFNVDEDGLYELILNVFYNKVDVNK